MKRVLIGIIIGIQSIYGMNIAIDIGHTEKKSGAYSCTGKKEYEYNKRFAKELGKELEKEKIEYKLINEEELKDRVKEVNKEKYDMFISIHHDSVKEKYLEEKEGKKYSNKFEGYSIFVSEKNIEKEKSKLAGEEIGKELIKRGFKYTEHHNEDIEGERKEWIKKEYGVSRYDNLIVLKGVKCPAVLIEVGIIVNEKEEEKMNKKEYRERMIKSIVKGIKEYDRVK